MRANPFVKLLGSIAGWLGIIQALTWVLLSLFMILIHYETWKPEVSSNSKTYGQLLSSSILSGYVTGTVSLGFELNVSLFIRANEFYIWGFLYLFLSIFWFGLSSYLLNVLTSAKLVVLRKIFIGWAILTSVISSSDLLLGSFLASDYNTLVGAINKANKAADGPETYKILACGVVMTLAFRGFILWLINITITVLMFLSAMSMPKTDTEEDAFLNTSKLYDGLSLPGSDKLNNRSSYTFGTSQSNLIQTKNSWIPRVQGLSRLTSSDRGSQMPRTISPNFSLHSEQSRRRF